MTTENLITTTDFCTWYNVERTFITSLHDAGLIEVTIINETTYIPDNQLLKLEKMLHLYQDLEINIAGIEAIIHLLDRVEQIQEDARKLRNRLRLYED